MSQLSERIPSLSSLAVVSRFEGDFLENNTQWFVDSLYILAFIYLAFFHTDPLRHAAIRLDRIAMKYLNNCLILK